MKKLQDYSSKIRRNEYSITDERDFGILPESFFLIIPTVATGFYFVYNNKACAFYRG